MVVVEAWKATGTPVPPVAGTVAVQFTVQPVETVMLPLLVQGTASTVTVRLQEKVPAVAYEWLGFCWVEVAPSPKDQA